MPTQPTSILSFTIDQLPSGHGPGFRRLAGALKGELIEKGPASGTRLPAVRELANQLSIHSSTVRAAYNLLEAEGWISSHVGRGSFVNRIPQRDFHFRFPPAVERVQALSSYYNELDRVPTESIDFFSLAPEVGPAALAAFRSSLDEAVNDEGQDLLSYGGPAGLLSLREHVAKWVSHPDHTLSPEDVLITNGAQQALELVIRCFVGPGEAVVAACPTYLNLMGTLEALGARLIPVPTGPDGLDLAALERAALEPGVRLLYVMPTFQNPTGISLDQAGREAFLAVSRQTQLPILEDNLAGHLRYAGKPLPTLHAMDTSGRVIQAGSVSKSLFPGLRIGWIVAPPPARSRLIALKRFSDLETARLPQAALVCFLAREGFEKHLQEQQEVMRGRRDRLVHSLERHLPPGCRWTLPDGGPSLWLEFPTGVDGREVAQAARRQGVLVAPGDLFYPDRRRTKAVRLSFARVSRERIDAGVEVLADLVREQLATPLGEGRQSPVI